MIENPPLDDDLLIHFGVKGMHWGHRKPRSDEDERKAAFQKIDRNRKIKIGIAVVGGAAAVALILSKSGRDKMTDSAVTNFFTRRQAQSQVANNPFRNLAKQFSTTKAASVPSPDQMIAEARMAGVRNRFEKSGAQHLTDKTWRDQTRLAAMKREMDKPTNFQKLMDAAKRDQTKIASQRRDMSATTDNLLRGNAEALANARRNSA